MKLKALPIAALLALTLTLTSCGDPGKFSDSEIISKEQKRDTDTAVTYNYADGASEPPKSYNSYTNAVESLSFNMLRKKFSQQNGESFVFSPSSTALQLSLLANGASADLRKEILLSFENLTTEEINQSASYFKSRMEEVGLPKKNERESDFDPLSAEHASLFENLFINSGNELTSAFFKTNADFYGFNIIRSDFSNNDFAQKQKNLFAEYVPNAAVGADKKSSMYSVSAVSVYDSWLVPYSRENIKDGEFNGADGKKKTSFMTSDENYLSTEKAEAVMKYTSKNPLKLLVIMPKGKTTLEDYLKLFDVAEYNSLLNSMNIKNNVKAELPQFSVDSGSEAKPLSGILSTCGFSTLFSKDAKFKTMNIANKLKLDEMYELEPSVTISSNGILNGASENTADISALKSGGGDTKLNSNKTLRFDKPFIFMLVDNESNIPVYAGVYQK